jgi:nucleoside phosphorylase
LGEAVPSGRIVVFVALPEEMENIYRHLTSDGRGECPRKYSSTVTNYDFTLYMKNGLEYEAHFEVLPNMGNLVTAVNAAKILARHRPHLAFLVGISGSLDVETFRLGDVIVSTSTKHYAADKLKQLEAGKERFEGDPDDDVEDEEDVEGEIDANTEAASASGGVANVERKAKVVIDPRKKVMSNSFFRFRRQWIERKNTTSHAYSFLKRWSETKNKPSLLPVDKTRYSGLNDNHINETPRVHVEALLGSDFVVDSEEFVAFLQDRNVDDSKDHYRRSPDGEFEKRNSWTNDPISAVDMESWGFFNVADVISPSDQAFFFSIRGISDLSSGKAALDNASNSEIRSAAAKNAVSILWEVLNFMDERLVGRP